MDEKKLEITRRKFLKASGKVAGAAVTKSSKLKGVGELIMPQEASKSGIGHLYQEVRRDLKGKVVGYGSIWLENAKKAQQAYKFPGGPRSKIKTTQMEYLGEVDLSDFQKDPSDIPEGGGEEGGSRWSMQNKNAGSWQDYPRIADVEYDAEGWPQKVSNKRFVQGLDEISMDLNDQIDHEQFLEEINPFSEDYENEVRAGQLRDAGEVESGHPFDSDEYGQKIKRLSQTARKLSDKLGKSHWLQEQTKKQIQSRSQMLLEHQNQQSQKKPSQVKQKVTQAIDLAKESPKTSSIVSGLSRFSGALVGMELAGANPFNPPKLGAPGIEEWKQQELTRKRKKALTNHQPAMEAAYP